MDCDLVRVAVAGVAAVGVTFFVYGVWFSTHKLARRTRSAHRIMVKAGTRFEAARHNLYDTLGLEYEPGADDEPQKGAIVAATRQAAGGPKAKSVGNAVDRYEMTHLQLKAAICEYHELGTAETDRAYGVPL